MQFGVLGPLQVIAGDRGEPATVSAARLRVLLAVLLWRANQPVPAGELAELVWDGAPPHTALEAIRALVMRLRRQLDQRAAARIVTRPAGYVIEVSAEELDASRFEALTREADAAVRAGRWEQAADSAGQALGCGAARRWPMFRRNCCGTGGCRTWTSCTFRRWTGGSRLTCTRAGMSS